jgi:hypothetical protein
MKTQQKKQNLNNIPMGNIGVKNVGNINPNAIPQEMIKSNFNIPGTQTEPLPLPQAAPVVRNPKAPGEQLNPDQINFDLPGGQVMMTHYVDNPIDPEYGKYRTKIFSAEEYKAMLGNGGFYSQDVRDMQNPQEVAMRNMTEQQRLQENQRLQEVQKANNILQNPDQQNTTGLSSDISGGLTTEVTANAAVGAAIGAVAAPATAGTSILAGAGIGAVGGMVRGFLSAAKSNKQQAAKEALQTFITGRQNMNYIIDALNKGSVTPTDAAIAWNEQKMRVYAAQSILKALTKNDPEKFLSEAGDERIRVEAFIEMIPTYERNLQAAMLKPNPSVGGTIPQDYMQENQPQ